MKPVMPQFSMKLWAVLCWMGQAGSHPGMMEPWQAANWLIVLMFANVVTPVPLQLLSMNDIMPCQTMISVYESIGP